MNVSSISENSARRNLFIKYANSFMSTPSDEQSEVATKTIKTIPENDENNKQKGIETLTTFSIFPKQVVNGQTIITA